MFAKKVEIYKKKDRETWQQLKDVLKAGGLKISAGHYFADVVACGGCGAKLDPRNFGAKGAADRDIYYIRVKESDRETALKLIHEAGLVTVVDEDAALDAAQRLLKKEEAER